MGSWHLEDGIYVTRGLQQPIRDFGYHVALGGGLLNNGYSDKDLDLYFLPMGGFGHAKVLTNQPEKLLEYLTGLWGEPRKIGKKLDNLYDAVVYKNPNVLAGGRGRAVPINANPHVPEGYARRIRREEERARIEEERNMLRHGQWLDEPFRADELPPIDLEAARDRIIEQQLFQGDLGVKKDLEPKENDEEYTPTSLGIYKHAVTFYRNTDRIDCFIF